MPASSNDPTTDPGLKSFIDVAEDSHFPIQNLPYGVFKPREGGPPRVGVRIGEFILDMAEVEKSGFMKGSRQLKPGVFAQPGLNAFLALGRPAWREARALVSGLLRSDDPLGFEAERERLLLPVDRAEMLLPAAIGDYTDFYSSKEHATNVGIMFRGKENALMPNWLELPVAYHGRSSSIVPSGREVRRPRGQVMPDGAERPLFQASRLLDFELEMGFFIGPSSEPGQPIPVEKARDHIFGMVLVNDWSARDIQKWEYQPLGPFNSKNFATTISPWIVTLDALEPFRRPGPSQEPEPLEYLRGSADQAYDIELEVWLQGARMERAERLCLSNAKHLYWNVCQQLAHHTITGCSVQAGDLMASGTISGPDEGGYGSMLELTWRGSKPIRLTNGEERKFIEDGDSVTMTGWCQGDGYRVGFGEAAGKLLPALK
jgi:fumarylacetoacetase